jgi:putative ABC transport system permease protein
MWNDIRLAARLLLKDRSFTLTAICALALGIAANNTVFTLINGALIRDLPFTNPDRVVVIGVRSLGNARQPFDNMSLPDLRDLQASARLFDGIGAADEAFVSVADDEHATERIRAAFVSANSFSLIGQRPALGRDFTSTDDQTGAPPVVILGHRVWQRRYAADPAVIGSTIRVNGVPSTVVGIMPEGFGFPATADLWQPLALLATPALTERGARNIDAFGRMAAGVTIDQATADLAVVMSRLARDYPATNRDIGPRVRPFRDANTSGPIRTVFAALMGAVVFLLLIACANVANLLLARGTDRARDVSVRLALGASRRQIVRQLLVESAVLSAIAGVAGVALAAAGVRAFQLAITGTGEPYWLEFPMDARALTFFVVVCAGTAMLFGLVPALHTSKTGLAGVLNEGGRGTAGSRRNRRWSGGLVVVQLALTIALLTGAGLMLRNLLVQMGLDAGIDTSRLVTMRLDLPTATYPTADRRAQFYRQLDERLAALPGISAGTGTWAPLGGAFERAVSIRRQPNAEAEPPRVSSLMIGPGYLEAIGATAVRGRTFVAEDGGPGRAAAIVNERFAVLHFPGGDALGEQIALEAAGGNVPASGWLTIVGVVPNVRYEEADPRVIEPVVYVPYASNPMPFATIVVRTGADAAATAATLRAAVSAIDRDLPLFDIAKLDDAVDDERWLVGVFTAMFGLFAAGALALSTIGLYGVTAYSVAQRTREIGVRIALGAGARDVWWVVTRRAAIQIGIGVVLGTAGALGVGQVLQGILSSVSGRDPATLIAVLALLIVVALAACVGPARRAMRLNPVAALRAE